MQTSLFLCPGEYLFSVRLRLSGYGWGDVLKLDDLKRGSGALTTANPQLTRENIRLAWRTNSVVLAAVGWVVFAILIAAAWAVLQYASPNIIGHDGYYHIKIAEVMRDAGLAGARLNFIWLPLTILGPNAFADHHYLYHVLLIPFTYFDLTQGAKLAGVVFGTATFLTVAWSLRRQQVFAAFVWAGALFLLSDPFLFRLAMTRAQVLSLLVLVLGIQWMIEGKYRRLAPLAFGYVWLYNAFLLLPLVAGLYVAAKLLVERKFDWQVLAFAGIGTAAGFLLHPFTPNNILFTVQHLYPKFIQPTTANVGSEWSPYQTWTLVRNSGPALALFALGTLGLGLRGKRMTTAELTWFLCTLAFGFLLLQARRFIEYYPAFALIFCAVVWSEPLRAAWAAAGQRKRALAVAVVAVTALVAGQFTFRPAISTIAEAPPEPIFQGAAAWLETNTPQGTRVFQTDWDDFPQLFYYNTHNTYTLGLDATYMELYDRNLYDDWVRITRGRVDNPGARIREQFGAEYVISDLEHDAFIEEARGDKTMEIVYSDNRAIVFHIQTAR